MNIFASAKYKSNVEVLKTLKFIMSLVSDIEITDISVTEYKKEKEFS